MFAVIVEYKCRNKAERDALVADLTGEEMAEHFRSCSGCLQYDYYVPCTSDTGLMLYSKWETEEDHRRHTQTQRFRFLKVLKEMRNAQSKVTRVQIGEV